MTRHIWKLSFCSAVLAALTGCASLTGSVSNLTSSSSGSLGSGGDGGASTQVQTDALPNTIRPILTAEGPIRLSAQQGRTTWSQNGGNANHSLGHLQFSAAPRNVWSQRVSSAMRRGRLSTSEPLIVAQTAFVMTWDLQVIALSLSSGEAIWVRDLMPENENSGIFGGGIAFANNTIFASTGAGQLHALSANSGAELWQQALPAPGRSGPLLHNGLVVVAAIDGSITAFSSNGEERWSRNETPSVSTLLEASTLAGAGNAVYYFESTGLLTALRTDGQVGWQYDLGLQGTSGSINDTISASRALPVVDGDFILASGWADTTVALTSGTGARIWEFPAGGASTPVLTNQHVFMITKDGALRALNRSNGAQVWAMDLGREIRSRRVPSVGWFGPVLAGGNLITVSSEGTMLLVDPFTGAIRSSQNIGSPAVANMALANGTLLITTKDGRIIAYR